VAAAVAGVEVQAVASVDTIPEAASADSAAAIPVAEEHPVTGRKRAVSIKRSAFSSEAGWPEADR
jgi:hypothetical protein